MGAVFPRDPGTPSVLKDSDPGRWRENHSEGRAGGSALPPPGLRHLPLHSAAVLGVPLVLQLQRTEVCVLMDAGVSARVCMSVRARRCRCERARV